MWRICVAGATGQMGRMVIEALKSASDLQLTSALSRKRGSSIGKSATAFIEWDTDIVITDDLDRALSNVECLIDFSAPDATSEYIDACIRHNVAMVIGTTAHDKAALSKIKSAAAYIPILHAPNLSIAASVMARLLAQAAAILPNYDVEILEAHNRNKIDAPSGTALWLGQVAAEARGYPALEVAIRARDSEEGPRKNGTIGMASIRGGSIVSEHTAMLLGEQDRIEIRHLCDARSIYAQGSLRCARFLQTQRPGLYDMSDIVGFSTTSKL
ncbi:4-hydroxy-tetrahydrodipicolinate reductase [Paraburkholderia heleia]|uniref:4-hydroxy-tetrahydrodipicolinate reductase n=1 Tax=Paraburkholderia heleia TaxID=634127 RepID=UPI002AB6C042|nr:4-hydroxy-tetrahydrodipicolinate reductase [Paraburkholderia heleia]